MSWPRSHDREQPSIIQAGDRGIHCAEHADKACLGCQNDGSPLPTVCSRTLATSTMPARDCHWGGQGSNCDLYEHWLVFAKFVHWFIRCTTDDYSWPTRSYHQWLYLAGESRYADVIATVNNVKATIGCVSNRSTLGLNFGWVSLH